jgi:mitogen-activated protein kinase 15
MAAASEDIDAHVEKRYEIQEKLGKGAYGIVWRAVDRKTRQPVALKKAFDAFANQTDAQRTYREVMFLQRVQHENIIKLVNVVRADNRVDLYMIFEIMETDLYATIRSNVLLDIHKQFVTYQLLRCMRFLHDRDIIHRDLKPANVLLNSDCHVKLADFGLARSLLNLQAEQQKRPVLTDYIATRWYRPPEIVIGSTQYTKAVDMWAMGCLIGELLTGKALFPGSSTINQMERIIAGIGHPNVADIESMQSPFAESIVGNLPAITPKPLRTVLAQHDREAVDLICKLLVFNPNKRLSCEQAMHHPFIAKFCTDEEMRPTDLNAVTAITLPLPDCDRLTVDEYRDALYKDIIRRKKEVKRKKKEKRALREARLAAKAVAKSATAESSGAPADGDEEVYEDDFGDDD